MVKIINHRFEKSPDITQLDCPKNTKVFERGQPDTIIIHYTAGRDGESSAKYLVKDNVKASAHMVLDRSGHIYQLVPFNTVSWHAGKSSYNGRFGFNQFSIGIEIDNAGILEPVGDKFKSWFGKTYAAEEVIKAKHRNESIERFWHTYTEEQINLTQEICELLMETYPTITAILGHEEISPDRKKDPGPAFPLDKLRNLFMESREEETPIAVEGNDGRVNVDLLNIRELPSIQSELAGAPLEKDTKVTILTEHDGWYKIATKKEGWVASKYVSFD